MLLLLEKWKKWQTKGASKREGGRESFRASRYSNIWYLYIVYQPFSLQIRCYSLLQPSAKIFFFVDELLSIRSTSSLKSCTGHNECKYFHLNVSLSSATFRVILERLFSSQTVYAPWVLEVLLQMGDQNLENTGTCNCSSECMYMIVQLCALKISRKWNFYYWRNECLEIQYSSGVECIIQCSQLAFFCTVSEFPVSKCRRQTSNQQL